MHLNGTQWVPGTFRPQLSNYSSWDTWSGIKCNAEMNYPLSCAIYFYFYWNLKFLKFRTTILSRKGINYSGTVRTSRMMWNIPAESQFSWMLIKRWRMCLSKNTLVCGYTAIEQTLWGLKPKCPTWVPNPFHRLPPFSVVSKTTMAFEYLSMTDFDEGHIYIYNFL